MFLYLFFIVFQVSLVLADHFSPRAEKRLRSARFKKVLAPSWPACRAESFAGLGCLKRRLLSRNANQSTKKPQTCSQTQTGFKQLAKTTKHYQTPPENHQKLVKEDEKRLVLVGTIELLKTSPKPLTEDASRLVWSTTIILVPGSNASRLLWVGHHQH